MTNFSDKVKVTIVTIVELIVDGIIAVFDAFCSLID